MGFATAGGRAVAATAAGATGFPPAAMAATLCSCMAWTRVFTAPTAACTSNCRACKPELALAFAAAAGCTRSSSSRLLFLSFLAFLCFLSFLLFFFFFFFDPELLELPEELLPLLLPLVSSVDSVPRLLSARFILSKNLSGLSLLSVFLSLWP